MDDENNTKWKYLLRNIRHATDVSVLWVRTNINLIKVEKAPGTFKEASPRTARRKFRASSFVIYDEP